ncbi:MAG: cbb3-type cytochrome oxidase assembly protein CcoS [Alphaproteobacteria bacterium]|nr:cbb3-type cytochrome oxidase assembly protein CcoS [Alphaproteobacteria bacterium]
MVSFTYLYPISLMLGVIGLAVFLWALRNGQYSDTKGDAERILYDDDKPLPPVKTDDNSPL